MTKKIISAAIGLVASATFLAAQSSTPMELWYQQHSYLTSPAAVQSVEATISQAAAAGYTGLVLWDSSLNDVNLSFWDPTYLQQVLAFAQSKGMKVMPEVFPYGYSYDILNQNPNLAEGQHVTGTRYQVNASGNGLDAINSSPGFQNPGFESGANSWFSYGDAGVSLDTTVAHTGSASASISNPPDNARLFQTISVTPWRQYHLRLWLKSAGFTSTPSLYVMDNSDWSAARVNEPLPINSTQDWTEYDFTLNSASSTTLAILLGNWGGAQGTLWIDDILFEETGLVYVVRRGGTPLRMYDPNNPSTTFNEGRDFNAISDPEVAPGGFLDHWHMPPAVSLPSSTSLRPGQIVAMDYYAVVPIYYADVGMCLTDPAMFSYLQANAAALAKIYPAGNPYMLGYDEMRHMNSCELCKSKNMTAGQLLAWSVQQSVNTFASASPGSNLYFWGDMFDPNFNAHNDYYLVEGDISGSWLGLPPNATIMNWNLGNLPTSLKFFAGLTAKQSLQFRQVISGFYDPGDNNGANAATSVLQQASGIPGVVGIMYTTWTDNYSQLASFAAAAKAAWPAYLSSVGSNTTPTTGSIAGTVKDSNGAAISGAQISAVLGSSTPVTAVTAGDGSFQLANIATGNYTVSVSASGYNAASVNATVTAGATTQTSVSLTAASVSFSTIRVNAGGGAYTDSSGNVWSADTGFMGGSTFGTDMAISNTSTPVLYQSERYSPGTLEYRFAVPNGTYNLTLKFAEIYFNSAGQRVFNIVLNGSQVTANFDPFAAAGGEYIAVDQTYSLNVTNGVVDIQLVSVVQNAKISAIQIAQAPSATSFIPIRVNAGGPSYTDPAGRVWSADAGSLDGSTYSTRASIAGTNTPVLYRSQRYCNSCTLEYKFAVPNGTYVVNLKFAEIWFTGIKQRVFNIVINGQTYEVNFDMVRLAGPYTAIDRRYPITVTGGAIDIQLVSVVQNPSINAIEITQTSFTPIRVNAGGPQITDPLGRVWSADTGFLNGNTYGNNNAILNTPAQAIYQSERYSPSGALEYKYSLANGTYTVNLKFAEIWFTAAGQRVYNIVINGNQMETNFDPLAASGGPNTAIDIQYQATVTNGTLDIQLVPVVQNPKISAIEIFQ